MFNPFSIAATRRFSQAYGVYISAHRLDFRMHNKLLVADNASALIGGRNIGDQYFQVDPAGQYADDDVLCLSPDRSATLGKVR